MAQPGTQLHKLQNAPHHIKVRWLIVFSSVAMAIIIAIWLLAFPSMVAIAPPATEANPDPKPELSGAASIFDTLIGSRR